MRLLWMLIPLLASGALAQPSPSQAAPAEPSKTNPGQPAGGDPIATSPPASATPEVTTEPVNPSTNANQERWYSLYKGKKFGVQLDVGVLDGAGLLGLFRPWWWLRVNAGLAYNILGVGIRGGLTVMPVHWAVTPTLSFDLGHYFSGDLTKFVTTSNPAEQTLLNNAAYNFWSAQIGVEFGSQQGFLFYLRAGLVYVGDTIPGQDLTNYLKSTGQTHYDRASDANFTALLPSFSLGFIYFIY